MKTALVSFLLGLLLIDVNSAFSQRNDSLNYISINKTFNSQPRGTAETIYYNVSDSLPIDLDADALTDMTIISKYVLSNANKSGWSKSITVIANKDVQILAEKNPKYPEIIQAQMFHKETKHANVAWSSNELILKNLKSYVITYHEVYTENDFASKKIGADSGVYRIMFRKLLKQDTIYGWLNLDVSFPGKVLTYAFACQQNKTALPETRIKTERTTICANENIGLGFFPEHGVVTSKGVWNNVYHPLPGQAAGDVIYYTATNPEGCPRTASLNIHINPLPKVKIVVAESNKDSVVFRGEPPGGRFEGDGLINNVYYFEEGKYYNIKYYYKDSNSCEGYTSLTNKGISDKSKTSNENGVNASYGFGIGGAILQGILLGSTRSSNNYKGEDYLLLLMVLLTLSVIFAVVLVLFVSSDKQKVKSADRAK